jgi:hypothetical protein
MKTNPLPQNIKTDLARLAVFPEKLTRAQLSRKLRELANSVDCDLNIPRSKLFLKIERFCLDFYDGEFDNPFDLAAVLEEMAVAAWKEFEESCPPSLRIE